MSTDTLFGFLAHRFVAQRENLATEALCYVLDRSQAARSAVAGLLRQSGAALPEGLTFRTQAAADDQAIPDLVGEDADGRQVLIAEAKFWAGLTDAQPVTYLRRLQGIGGGVLAVIAPEARLELLWRELVRRCEETGITVTDPSSRGAEMRAAALHPGGHLVLITWRSLLSAVLTAVENSGEIRLAADVMQLQGLCDRADDEAFFPLSSDELTGSMPRRLIQFNKIVDDAYGLLAGIGIADGRGMRSSAGSGWYGRYCRIHGVPCLLMITAWMWGKHAYTPLWLRMMASDWKTASPAVGRALQPLAGAGVPVLAAPDGHNVPIFLPVGVERDVMVRAVMDQLERIASLLQPLGTQDSPTVEPASVLESASGEELAVGEPLIDTAQ